MVCWVREVRHPFRVVCPVDEALCSKAVCTDVDETSEGAENQGDEKVPEDLFPGSLSPQLLNRELSSHCTEVNPIVYLVTCGTRLFFTFLYFHVLFNSD